MFVICAQPQTGQYTRVLSLEQVLVAHLGVIDPGGKLLRRESAEDQRVNGADASARQHGDDGFRNHRHVDKDAVALDDAT